MIGRYPRSVQIRVMQHITDDGDGCWISTYSTGSHGYAQVGWHEGGRVTMTLCHRVAYELAYGPIPDGLTVDHLCRVQRCVNPAHLRLLTNVENARDNGASRRTHCPAGHPYDEVNTYLPPSGRGRQCRACRKTYKSQRARAA